MGNRTRQQIVRSDSGEKYNLQGVLVGTVQNLSSSSTCNDLVAAGDGHNLNVRHLTTYGCKLNYQTSGSISGRRWKNWQVDRCRNPDDSMYGHTSVLDQPSDAMLAAKLIASTNPSRPVVDLPIAVYELKDMPGLLKDEGRDIVRGLAKGHLANEFAIKPFINDLTSLLSFSDEVDKRERELDKLAKGGLKRKRDLWAGSSTYGPTDWILQSGDKLIVHMDLAKTTQRDISGFVIWYPDSLRLMKGDMRALAKKAVLGMTIDFSTAWNALPWSWLIDWCGNIGDILISKRNLVGARPSSVQLMTHTTTTASLKPTSYLGHLSDGGFKLESKQRRRVTSVPVDVQLPILNGRQLSILGSIGVTRRKPRNTRPGYFIP